MDAPYCTLPLFYALARLRNFTKAARSLEIGLSTLSRRIGNLEKQLGVQLFLRDTRNVELTTAGRMLFERCEFIFSEAEDAYEAVYRDLSEVRGQIRISIHPDIYHDYLTTALTDFAISWPDIRLRLILSERAPEPPMPSSDMDIRFEAPADTSMSIRTVLTGSPRLYASPDVFKSRPWPETPLDLQTLPCIHMHGRKPVWTFFRGDEKAEIAIQPTHTSNSMLLGRDMAVAGLGVCFLFPASAEEHAKSGRLVQVLHEWSGPLSEVYMALDNRRVPRRVALLAGHIENHVFAAWGEKTR